MRVDTPTGDSYGVHALSSRSVALVSGGSRGLGLSIVRHLLENGWTVATFSRRATEQTEQLKEQYGDLFSFFPGDMADAASLSDVVRIVEQEVGPIAALVNNAGIARDGVLAVFPESQIEEVLSINLIGTLHLTREVVRRMLVRRSGRVINISSIIGLRGYVGLAVYSASKAGMDGMTRSLARELGPRNITVNSIAPGYLETEMTGTLAEEQRGQIIRRTPLGRLGTPEDVVGTVDYLLSDAAKFITGQTIVIDGGISC